MFSEWINYPLKHLESVNLIYLPGIQSTFSRAEDLSAAHLNNTAVSFPPSHFPSPSILAFL